MQTYERYVSDAERRKAQRAGVKRGVASGKAFAYVLAFDHQPAPEGHVYALMHGPGVDVSGNELDPAALALRVFSKLELKNACRKVSFESLPYKWRRCLALALREYIMRGKIEAQIYEELRRYRRILWHGSSQAQAKMRQELEDQAAEAHKKKQVRQPRRVLDIDIED